MSGLSVAAAQLAEVLRAQTSGNNQAIAASIQKLVAMQRESQNYCMALCEIVEKDARLRSVALTQLNRCFSDGFEGWPDDFKSHATERIIGILSVVSAVSDVLTVSEILVNIYRFIGAFPGLEVIFEPGKQSLLTQLSVAEKILKDPKLVVHVMERLDIFVDVVVRGLAGSWDQVVIAMRSLPCVLGLDEELLGRLLDPLMGLVDKSLELDETMFLGFWSDLGVVFAVSDLPKEAVFHLVEVAGKIGSNRKFGAFATLSAVQCVLSVARTVPVPPSIWANFASFSLNIAAEEQGGTSDLESPLADICESVICALQPGPFFESLQQWSSESPKNMSVCLLVMSLQFRPLQKVIKQNWDWCCRAVETMGKAQEPIWQENLCRFLSALDSRFESLVLTAGLFMPVVVPLIVSESPEVRYHAREALYSMIDMQTTPVPNLVSGIWSVNGQVHHEAATYLTLVAKCLENEGEQFSAQSISEMAAFVTPFLQSGDPNVITGALAVATVLLSFDEEISEQLAPPTVHAIFACLTSKSSDELVINSLKRIADLHEMLREMIVSDPAKLELIKDFLDEEDKNAGVARMAVLASCSLMPGVPFIEAAFQVLMKHIVSNSADATDMTALTRLAKFMPPDQLQAAFSAICEQVKAAKAEDEDTMVDYLNGLAAIVRDVKNEGIVNDAILLARMGIAEKLPNIAADSIDVQNSFVGLLCDILAYKSDANREFFQYAMILAKNPELLDGALCIFGAGVAADAFIEPEMKSLVELMASLLEPDTSADLMHSCAYLLREMLKKDILVGAPETLWGVLSSWFQQLSALPSMGVALCNVAAAIWVLALKIQRVDAALVSSISVFPPDDLEDTGPMGEMLLQMVSNPAAISADLKGAVVAAVTRLLCLSRLFQKRRHVDDAMRAQFAAALKQLIAGDEQAQAIMTQTTGDSPSRQRRIQALLQ